MGCKFARPSIRRQEVRIPHSTRAGKLTIAIAVATLAACSSAIRPTQLPPPNPSSPTATTSHAAGPTDQDSSSDSLLPQGAARDSIDAKLNKAAELANSLFGIDADGDRPFAFRDVDSTFMTGGEEETTWDIDVHSYVTEDKVARYVDVFTGRGRPQFAAWLQRGRRYEPMIRAKFRDAGIPEDMYFLALVESGYNEHAYSRAAAVGMWQFMTATARGVGLRVDWWVDERRDPVRATDAAARFLGDLRDQFGSMYLAAAAYNGGPGRVSRGLKKYDGKFVEVSGDDRFFALAAEDYLRSETKNYVPQLIAAALVGKNPSAYGIALDSVAPYAYDSVVVPPRTPLAAVAKATGVTIRDILELNGHFLRGVTAPDKPATVRVPVGTGEGFAAEFDALSDADRDGFVRVKSKTGQTLRSIGAQHGVGAQHMAWFNRGARTAKSGRLVAGQAILVPSEMVVAAALDVPDPAIERYGTTASTSGRGRTVHIVRKGESLGLIAKRYGTTVRSLVQLNGLRKQVIYPGQSIIVRSEGARPAARKAATTKKKPASSARRSPPASAKPARSSS